MATTTVGVVGGVTASILSGLFGATASCLGKMAFHDNDESRLVNDGAGYCLFRPIESLICSGTSSSITTATLLSSYWNLVMGGDETTIDTTATTPATVVHTTQKATATSSSRFQSAIHNTIKYYWTRIQQPFLQSTQHQPQKTSSETVDKSSASSWCHVIVCNVLPRALCFVVMLVCNAIMLAFFVKGMEDVGSVQGTAISTALNFITSAMYGYIVWNERYTTTWYIGFAMILCGVTVLLICSTSTTTETTTTTDTSTSATTTPQHSIQTTGSNGTTTTAVNHSNGSSFDHDNKKQK